MDQTLTLTQGREETMTGNGRCTLYPLLQKCTFSRS